MNFKELGLDDNILKAIEEEGFEAPTEVQEKTIQHVLEGRDVVAGAATGSGKTLAFSSGIIQNIDRGNGIQALVMTPTRELAQQVAASLSTFSKHNPLSISMIYGGVDISPQIKELQKADVVVGTPGRILDHLQRKTLDLSNVNMLVLDEADRMLDMGFIDDVEKIMSKCSKNRQTLFFSATIRGSITKLAEKHMNENYLEVLADSYVDKSKLEQYYYNVPENLKFSLLVHLLEEEESDQVIVFCNTRNTSDFIAKNLELAGFNATSLHGGYSQHKRDKKLKNFDEQNVEVVCCTNVASRGIDIEGITHVYNFDIPNDPKEYVHRIGRTARAGMSGKVINLLCEKDHDNFRRVNRENDVDIQCIDKPYVDKVPIRWTPGKGGKKKSYKGRRR